MRVAIKLLTGAFSSALYIIDDQSPTLPTLQEAEDGKVAAQKLLEDGKVSCFLLLPALDAVLQSECPSNHISFSRS